MKTILQTSRLIVRHYKPEEEHLLLAMGDDELVSRYTTRRTKEQTRELFKEMLLNYETQPGLGRWAIFSSIDNEFIGHCILLKARTGLSGTEVGYMLHQKYWGAGMATELVQGLVDYAFNQIGIDEVCAITNQENIPSQRVLLKAGFISQGTILMGTEDLLLYKITKGD